MRRCIEGDRYHASNEEPSGGFAMTNAWPSHGPSSYFPSIEKKYEKSIAEWQQIIVA